jgi:hypothetical protein
VRRVRRWLAGGLGTLLIVALLSACGSQAEKQAGADALRDSVPTTAGHRTRGLMVMSSRPIKVPEGTVAGLAAPAVEGAAAAEVAASPPFGFVADRGAGRVAVLTDPAAPPVFLAGPEVYYARRPSVRPNERRPWVRVELHRLDEEESPSAEALVESAGAGWLAAAGPHVMFDLLAGVLAGSVKTGKAAEDGSRTYRFNVSVDKANRELDRSEDERDERSYVLRSIAIKGDIFPGEATLDGDGALSRLKITFFQTPDRLTKLGLVIELRILPALAELQAVKLAPPARATTIRLSTMPAFTSTFSQTVDADYLKTLAASQPTTTVAP